MSDDLDTMGHGGRESEALDALETGCRSGDEDLLLYGLEALRRLPESDQRTALFKLEPKTLVAVTMRLL